MDGRGGVQRSPEGRTHRPRVKPMQDTRLQHYRDTVQRRVILVTTEICGRT